MPGGRGNIRAADNPKPFTSDRQPENRKQPDLISALIKKELQSDGWAIFEDAEILDENQKPTGQKVQVRVKLTTAQAVARRLLANAAKGRERSIEIVLDRTEGKIPQYFNVSGKNGNDLQINVSTLSTDEKRKMLELVRKAKANPGNE